MLVLGEVWKTLGFWSRKVAGCCKWNSIGQLSRNMEDICAKSYVGQVGTILAAELETTLVIY